MAVLFCLLSGLLAAAVAGGDAVRRWPPDGVSRVDSLHSALRLTLDETYEGHEKGSRVDNLPKVPTGVTTASTNEKAASDSPNRWIDDPDWYAVVQGGPHAQHHITTDRYDNIVCRECSSHGLYLLRHDEIVRLLIMEREGRQ